MEHQKKRGARNPKEVRTSIRLTDEIDRRIEALSDAAGQNKGTMMALLVAASLEQFETMFMGMRPERLAQATRAMIDQVKEDVTEVAAVQSDSQQG